MLTLVHLDVETTGLDPAKHQIIEIGMIVDDFTKPRQQLPRFSCLIKHDPFVIDAFCLKMHRDRWGDVCRTGVTLDKAADQMVAFFKDNGFNSNKKIVFCGKNVGAFDYQFLKAEGLIENLRQCSLSVAHRMIDVGTLWTTLEDSVPPDLKECCKRAGLGDVEVPHTALGDCELTVQCVRKYYNRGNDA